MGFVDGAAKAGSGSALRDDLGTPSMWLQNFDSKRPNGEPFRRRVLSVSR